MSNELMNFIRVADSSDRPGIITLVKTILKEFNQIYDDFGSERDLEKFDFYYKKDRCAFYVIVNNQTIIGTIGLLQVSQKEAKIRKMYVSSEFRNLGLANALMDQVIEKAVDLGYKKLFLETMSVMKSAIYLYKKFGFIQVNRTPQSTRCDVVMEKVL